METPAQLITIEEFIDRAKKAGYRFGKGNPKNRLRYLTKTGVLPHAVRLQAKETDAHTTGFYLESALQLLLSAQKLKRQEKLSAEKIADRVEPIMAAAERGALPDSLVTTLRRERLRSTAAEETYQPINLLTEKLRPFYLPVFAGTMVFLLVLSQTVFGKALGDRVAAGVRSALFPGEAIRQMVAETGLKDEGRRTKDEGKVLAEEDLKGSDLPKDLILSVNLLKNSSFESAGSTAPAAFWQFHPNSTDGNTQRSSHTSHSGSYSLLITADTGGVLQEATKTEAGRNYTLGVWVKIVKDEGRRTKDEGGSLQPYLHLALGPGWDNSFDITESSTESQPQKVRPFVAGDGWRYYSTAFENPPPGLVPRIYITIPRPRLGSAEGGQNSVFVFLDDARMSESESLAEGESGRLGGLGNLGNFLASGFQTLVPSGGNVLSVTADGILYPTDDSQTQGGLGTDSNRFGKAWLTNVDLSENLSVNGKLDISGKLTANGNLTLGNNDGDEIEVGGRFTSDLLPKQSNAVSLGTSGNRWNNLFAAAGNISNNLAIGGNTTMTGSLTVSGGLTMSGGSGLSVTGDLSLDGDLDFQGPQNITTTSDNLTVSPTGNLILDSSGGTLAIRDAAIDLTNQPTTVSGSTLSLRSTGTFIIDTSANNTDLRLQGGLGELRGDYGTIVLAGANSITLDTSSANSQLRIATGTGAISISSGALTAAVSQLTLTASSGPVSIWTSLNSNGEIRLRSAGTLQLDTSANNTNVQVATGSGDFNVNAGQLVVDGNGSISLAPSNSQLTITGTTTLGDGGTTNYLSVSSTGDLTFLGSANNLIANNDLVLRSANSLTLDTSANNANILIDSGTGDLTAQIGSGNIVAEDDAAAALIFRASSGGIQLSTQSTDNGNLTLYSAGTLTLDSSGNNTNILILPGSGRIGVGTTSPATAFHISASDGLVIPAGTTAQRAGTPTTGTIRYNSQTSQFEGYSDSSWGSLGGVIDVDQDTYVSAEDSAGSDNDDLKFITAATQRMMIDETGNVGIGPGPGSVLPAGILDVVGNAPIILRAGQSALNNSTSGATSTTADIQLAAADQLLAAAGSLTFLASNDSAYPLLLRSSQGGIQLSSQSRDNGGILISSAGNLYIDTSFYGTTTYLQGGLVRVGSGGTANNVSGSGALYIQGNLEVDGSVWLGDISSDDLTLTGQIGSDLVPNVGSTYDLGSTTNRWAEIWGDTLTVTTLNSSANNITGITSSSFTIDTSNASSDTEDISITFERGTPGTNSQFLWDSSEKYFSLNAALNISPDTDITTLAGEHAILNVNDSYRGRRIATFSEGGTPRAVIDSSGNILLYQSSNIETSAGTLTMRGYSGLTLTTSSATTGEIRVLSRGTLQLDTSTNNDNILLRAGTGNINLSAGAVNLTAITDSVSAVYLNSQRGGITLSSSNASGNGPIRILSGGSLQLSTSQGNQPIYLQAGTGNLNVSSNQLYLTGNLVVTGTETFNGVAYTFPGGDGSSSNVLTTSGTWLLSWETLGAASITVDSLDFTEFQDSLDLDADTSINGPYSFIIRTGNAARQNATSGNNDLQLSAEDALIVDAGDIAITASEDSTYPLIFRSSAGGIQLSTQSADNGNLTLYSAGTLTLDSSRNNTNVLILPGTGNVGIGSTAPGYKLDVVGSLGVLGDFALNGDLDFTGPQNITTTADNLTISPTGNLILDTSGGLVSVRDGVEIQGARTGKALLTVDETGDQDILTASKSGTPRLTITRDGNIKLHQTSTIYTIAGDLQLQTSSNRNDNIVIRTYDSAASTANGDDIFIAAQDNLYLGASTLTLETTSGSAGQLVIRSDGTLQLDTSANNTNLVVNTGSGSIDLNFTGELQIDGGLTDIGSGTYTLANGDNDLGVEGDVEINGNLQVDGTITGATAFNCTDCINFDDLADELNLDADTSINGDYSLIVRAGLGARQNATSGSNDLQLAAEDAMILDADDFTLTTSNTGVSSLQLISKGVLRLDTSTNNNNILLSPGTGNVGIGTTGPGGKLEVNTGAAWNQNSQYPFQFINLDPNGSQGYGMLVKAGANDNSEYSFTVQDYDGNVDFTIKGGGNVGIGTTGPLGVLDVLGQCVAGDTLLLRRKRRKIKGRRMKDEGDSDWWLDEWEQVRIDQIKEGDEILTLDEAAGRMTVAKVKQLMDKGIKPTYKLTTADGRSIRTTAQHPYLTPAGWKKVDQIKTGDKIAVLNSRMPSRTLVKSMFAFLDETGISSGDRRQTEMGVGILTLTGNRDEIFSFNQELRKVFLSALDILRRREEVFEFKFKYVTKTSLPLYQKLIDVLDRYRQLWNFSWAFAAHNNDPWRQYLKLTSGLLSSLTGSFTVVADHLDQPANSTESLEVLEKLPTVNGVLPVESQGTIFLQISDILLGALGALRNSREDKIKKELTEKIAAMLLGNKKATVDPVYVAPIFISRGRVFVNPQYQRKFVRVVSVEEINAEQVWDIEVGGTHNFVANGIVAHNTTSIAMRAGSATLEASNLGTSSTTADIQLYAADSLLASVGDLTLQVSEDSTYPLILRSAQGGIQLSTQSADNGNLTLYSAGTLTLDSSRNNTNIILSPGTGNVGIGTTGPLGILDVIGNSSVLLRAGQSSLQLSGSAASTTADIQLAAADRIDLFAGSLSLQTSSTTAGDLKIISKGSLILDTSSSLGGSAPIIMNGNVGIGTTGPGAKLHILVPFGTASSHSTVKGLIIQDAIFNDGNLLEIQNLSGGNLVTVEGSGNLNTYASVYNITDNAGYYFGGGSQGRLYYGDAIARLISSTQIALSTNSVERIRIDTSGNVGIGTTSPQGILDVLGACLTKDAKIRRRRRRKNGEWEWEDVPITDIKAGDEVMTLDEAGGKLTTATVKKLMNKGIKGIYELKTITGKTIRTTGNHPYLAAPETIAIPNSNFLYEQIFDDTENLAQRFYHEVLEGRPVAVPALGDEKVNFTHEGWKHISDIRRGRKPEVIFRYFALPKVLHLMSLAQKLINGRPDKIIKDGKLTRYYAIQGIIEGVWIKAVIRQIEDKPKHFYSVLWKGEEATKPVQNAIKKGAVSRLYPRRQDWDFSRTLSAWSEYTSFIEGLSRGQKESPSFATGGVPDGTSSLATARNILPDVSPFVNGGKWTKVNQLRVGQMIATQGKNDKPMFERITSIRKLPAEQVYDLEIETTHNFVANGIVAHNTTSIALRAGAAALEASNLGTSSTTADIQLYAADSMLASVGDLTLQVSEDSTYPLILRSAQGGIQLSTQSSDNGNLTLYSAGTLTLDSSRNNTNILLLPGTGNVGIGTTGPSTKLHVVGNGTYSAAFMSGNVGIGTVTPAANLEIYNGGSSSSLRLMRAYSENGYGAGIWSTYADVVGVYDSLALGAATNGNPLSNEAMRITSARTVGIGEVYPGSKLSILGGISVGETTDYSRTAAPTGGMIIKGNVGIGTTGPLGILDVIGNSSVLLRAGQSSLQLSGSAASTTADIQLAAADRIDLFAGSLSLQTSSQTAGELKLMSKGSLILDTSGAAGGGAPIVMLGGNVGIGTTAPGGILDVLGACLTKDAKIRRRRRRKNGEWEWEDVPITDIKAGDEVMTLDEAGGKLTVSTVKRLMNMGHKKVFRLTTADGKTIRTTAKHPYLVKNEIATTANGGLAMTERAKWVKVTNLKPGDKIAVVKKLSVGAFIDYANMKAWVKRQGKMINLAVLYQALKNSGVEKVSLYYGTDPKNPASFGFLQKLRQIGFEVITKPVKYQKVSLLQMLRRPVNWKMLLKLSAATRTALLHEAGKLEKKRVRFLSPKANFDVEISLDMVAFADKFDGFVLFSGDGDFEATVKTLRAAGKKVIVVSHQKFLAGELNQQADRVLHFEDILKGMPSLTQKTPDEPGKNCELIVSSLSAFVNSGKPAFVAIASIIEEEAEQVYDLEIEATHNFVANGIVAHNTSGLLMRAGAASLQLSSSATSTTADIQLAAADRIDLFAGSLSLQTSSTSAGDLKIISKGSLILDTSSSLGGSAPIIMNGNVGIGTTGPGAKLEILSANTVTDTYGNLSVLTNNSAEVNMGGQITLGGYYNGTSSFSNFGTIAGRKENNTAGDPKGYLAFGTIYGANSEKMRITSGGNVGIGTTGPLGILDVIGNSSVLLRAGQSSLQLSGSATSTTADIQLAAADRIDLFAGSLSLQTSSTSAGDLKIISKGSLILDTSSSLGGSAPIILQGGNVGIGTTGPLSKLAVNLGVGENVIFNQSQNTGNETIFKVQYLGSDKVTFSNGGLAYFAGNVGIGTTSPSGVWTRNLNIHDTTSGGNAGATFSQPTKSYGIAVVNTDFRIYDNTAGAYRLSIDTTGNVGIGTTGPLGILDVIGNSSVLLRAGQSSLQLSGSAASTTADIQLAAADRIDLFAGSLSLQTSSTSAGDLKIISKGSLILDTSSSLGGSAPIIMNGNVGIGTTGPGAKLDVQSSSGKVVSFNPSSGTAGNEWWIDSTNPDHLKKGDNLVLSADPENDDASTVITFNVDNSEKVRIDSNGNVGIGTTGPVYTLDVSGGTRVIGDAGVILRAGRSSLNLSSGTTSTTADLQLAAADRIDLFAGSLSLQTSSQTAGELKLMSKGSLILDTSGGSGDLIMTKLNSLGYVCTTAAGVVTAGGASCATSDIRLKTDIRDLSQDMNVLESLEKLRGVSFAWDETNPANAGAPTGRQVGMIAQEVEQVLPSLVNIGSDGYRRLDYAKMTGYLVEVAKEQQKEITQLSASNLDTNLDIQTASPSASLADLDLLKTRVSSLEDLVNLLTLSASSGANVPLSTLPATGLTLDQSSEFRVQSSADLPFGIQNSVFSILSPASIGGSLTVGLITIDDLDASINSIGETLKIQNQALADVEFLGGKIVMTKTGDMEILGDLGVLGDLEVGGDLVVGGTVAGTKFEVLEQPENPATDSARPAAASIGETIIPAGRTALTIYSTAVTANSKVFVTADQPAALGAKVTATGQFTIELAEPTPAPLKVSWWVVN